MVERFVNIFIMNSDISIPNPIKNKFLHFIIYMRSHRV